jgi:hypothetical protein
VTVDLPAQPNSQPKGGADDGVTGSAAGEPVAPKENQAFRLSASNLLRFVLGLGGGALVAVDSPRAFLLGS